MGVVQTFRARAMREIFRNVKKFSEKIQNATKKTAEKIKTRRKQFRKIKTATKTFGNHENRDKK